MRRNRITPTIVVLISFLSVLLFGCGGNSAFINGPETITIHFDTPSIKVNESKNAIIEFNPPDIIDNSLTWECSNEKVATVDSNGKVTGISAGTAVIIATAPNGMTATSTISVMSSGSEESHNSINRSSNSSSLPFTDKDTDYSYIKNRNTKKFHLPSCYSVSQMNEENKIYSNQSREEIINEGYSPCKRCNP